MKRDVPKAGRHCCAVPKSFRESFATAAGFLSQGVKNGRRCVYVAHDNGLDVARMALKSHGLAVEELEADDKVLLAASQDTPLAAGVGDPERLYRAWAQMTDAAVAQGHSGLAVVVEMTWALEQDLQSLARYEKGAGPLFESKPIDALCVYNWNAFHERVIKAAAIGGHEDFLADGSAAPGGDASSFARFLGVEL